MCFVIIKKKRFEVFTKPLIMFNLQGVYDLLFMRGNGTQIGMCGNKKKRAKDEEYRNKLTLNMVIGFVVLCRNAGWKKNL